MEVGALRKRVNLIHKAFIIDPFHNLSKIYSLGDINSNNDVGIYLCKILLYYIAV